MSSNKWYEGKKVVVFDGEYYTIKKIHNLTTVDVEWYDGFRDTVLYKSVISGKYTGRNNRKVSSAIDDIHYPVGSMHYVDSVDMYFVVKDTDGDNISIRWETGEDFVIRRKYLHDKFFTVTRSKYFPKKHLNRDALIVCDNFYPPLSASNDVKHINVLGIKDIEYTKDKLSFSLLRDVTKVDDTTHSIWSWVDYEIHSSWKTGVDGNDLAILYSTCLLIQYNFKHITVMTLTNNILDFGIEYSMLDKQCPAYTTFKNNISKIKEWCVGGLGREDTYCSENNSVVDIF